jgi:hypothetical protein
MAMQKTNAIVKEVCIDDVLKEDADKGKWIELEEDSVHEMFRNLANLNEGDPDQELLDSRYNFEAYGADWYQGKFPGFPEDWYDILATEHKSLNSHLEEASDDPVSENPTDYQ